MLLRPEFIQRVLAALYVGAWREKTACNTKKGQPTQTRNTLNIHTTEMDTSHALNLYFGLADNFFAMVGVQKVDALQISNIQRRWGSVLQSMCMSVVTVMFCNDMYGMNTDADPVSPACRCQFGF